MGLANMGHREPFERLRRDLLRRGLPAGYVRRAVLELSDHHADLLACSSLGDDSQAADAWRQLGDVDRLGKQLARDFHSRSFAGRHPVVTFLIAPLPALFLLWTAVWCSGWLLLFGVLSLLGLQEGQTVAEMPPGFLWTMLTCHYGMLFVPPAVASLWFCRLALRSGRGMAWAAPACLLVASLAFTFICELRLPHEAHQGQLLMGFGIPLPAQWRVPQIIGLWQALSPGKQLLHAVGPLTVLTLAWWQVARSNRQWQPIGC